MKIPLPISDEWLAEVGFKWHRLEGQNQKHWLLWLGECIDKGGFSSHDDLGIEVARRDESTYFCWLRADYAGRYSRFIFVRDVFIRDHIVQLVEAITGQAWDPQNHLYGSLRRPATAARIREEAERLDRRIMRENKWREIEQDETRGGSLPEHLEAYNEGRSGDG